MTVSTVNNDPKHVVSFRDQQAKSKPVPPAGTESKKSNSWKRNQYLAALAGNQELIFNKYTYNLCDFNNSQHYKLIANFGAIQFGTLFGWSAAAMPYLRNDERQIITSSIQESWITSLVAVSHKPFMPFLISLNFKNSYI